MITIHGTNQNLFDRACEHIAAQGRLGKDDIGANVYRAVLENGDIVSCLIGGLIPSSAYSPDLEGSPVSTLIFDKVIEFPEAAISFVEALQDAHDSNTVFTGMKRDLAYVAKRFDLDATKINIIKNGVSELRAYIPDGTPEDDFDDVGPVDPD